MDIDSDEEPEEIDGVSNLDYDVVVPQPAQMGVLLSTTLMATRRQLWITFVYTPLSIA
jgi:hypothetical protein